MSDEISAVELAAELTAAWLANPNTRTNADDVPAFLVSMHAAVVQLTGAAAPAQLEEPAQTYEPAVTARKSLASPDHIISMIDGKPYKTLRRHLATNGLTPEDYRARYNLKADYPMVAPTYSEARRTMAKSIGLGRKPGQTVAKAAEEAPKAVRKPRVANQLMRSKSNRGEAKPPPNAVRCALIAVHLGRYGPLRLNLSYPTVPF